ncbi:hypothetical protein B296_00008626 [Ensete ventricosum]|uniref:Late embryogenesis abundant protein LEA-2 subgroup domain-containing protein n=1 Tax=Ensete ventricosum TaxID=4639 RepID=A0A427ACS3_ENSVE|nr:hypothetical protein B296_00008626 [Ensete ventricosum]
MARPRSGAFLLYLLAALLLAAFPAAMASSDVPFLVAHKKVSLTRLKSGVERVSVSIDLYNEGFSLAIAPKVFHTELYRPYQVVCTGPLGYWYTDRPLPDGTVKIDRRQSISAIDGRFREKSTVGGRLREKKGRRRISRPPEKDRGDVVPF